MLVLKSLEAVLALPALDVLLSLGKCIVITVIQHLITGHTPLMGLLLSAHTDSTSSMTCLNMSQAAITRIPWNVEANIDGPQWAHSSRLVCPAGFRESMGAVILGIGNMNWFMWDPGKRLFYFFFYITRQCFWNKICLYWVRWKHVCFDFGFFFGLLKVNSYLL